jgi:hypothetical protein
MRGLEPGSGRSPLSTTGAEVPPGSVGGFPSAIPSTRRRAAPSHYGNTSSALVGSVCDW